MVWHGTLVLARQELFGYHWQHAMRQYDPPHVVLNTAESWV